MNQFRQVVDDCGFLDLGFYGPSFTWWNNRDGAARVLEQLDRGLGSAKWLHRFPLCQVHHMHVIFSDHKPLWIELNPVTMSRRPRKKVFHFEEIWTLDPSCEKTIRLAWVEKFNGSSMYQVVEKIKASRRSLQCWSKNHFGNIRSSINSKTRQLQCEEDADPAVQNVMLIKNLRNELTTLFTIEEKMRQ